MQLPFVFRPLLALLLLVIPLAHGNAFSERLTLKPLPRGSLLASFDFDNSISQADFDNHHYRLFPRSLAQILHHAHVKELHLRFTTGRWDEQLWGRRTAKEGSTGVEIWAWIEAGNNSETSVKRRWSTLVNSISGLFCASVHNVDSTRIVSPQAAFEPDSIYHNGSSPALHLIHGMLPNEVVCTENLTPFMKLLPCKGKAGISSLFDGHRLFDANWQNLAVDVRTVCSNDGVGCKLELQQSVAMVLDIARSSRPLTDPLPRPIPQEDMRCDISKGYNIYGDACFPQPDDEFPQFNITQVFGHAIRGSCPLTAKTGQEAASICVEPASQQAISVNTTAAFQSFEDSPRICYEIAANADFDVGLSSQSELTPEDTFRILTSSPSLIQASRTMTGRGQENGGMRSVLVNPYTTDSVTVVYLETYPWFLRPYLHTLRTEVRRTDRQSYSSSDQVEHPVEKFHYHPAIDRKRPTHLEMTLTIPPASTLTLFYEFEKSVLRYTEYPPDANRGFDLPAAIIRVVSPVPPSAHSSRMGASEALYVRTTTLLLYLMTPDFSMPYNVIILTSTVIALGFGSIFNLLVRRLVLVEEADAVAKEGLLGRIITGVKSLKARVGAKSKKE